MHFVRSWFCFALLAAAMPGSLPASLPSAQAAPSIVLGSDVTDLNGDTLLAGDSVKVTITIANVGDAETTVTLIDTLTNLVDPVNPTVDGFLCGTCFATFNTLTAPIGTMPQGAVHVLLFFVHVPQSPAGPDASSSAVAAFSPDPEGTSPTSPDIASLSIDSIFLGGFEAVQ
jgi:hypothetical protein